MEEQERIGWEMAVRIEKIIATVLDEAHELQVEEVLDTPSKRGRRACTSALLIDPCLIGPDR